MTRSDAMANLLVRAHHAARPKRFSVSITRADGTPTHFDQIGGSSIDAASLGMEIAGLGGVVRVLECEIGGDL